MSHLAVVHIDEQNERAQVEADLRYIMELEAKIRELTAESTMIKDRLKETYFAFNDEFKTDKGLVLATYKEIKESRFNSDKFKKDHGDIYEMYKEEKFVRRFLLKK